MIPSALIGQLKQGLADFLRFSFWSSTPGMENVVEDLLGEPGGLLKGPYVSLKLPFGSGKRRLQADDGSLCCVGTSATLGGAGAAAELRAYAGKVFGEPFDRSAVIGESRLSVDEFLDGCPREWISEPGEADKLALDPARATANEAWIRSQMSLWLGGVSSETGHEEGKEHGWPVVLGHRPCRCASTSATCRPR